jgi:pimeloyl-ACP methyl ester carboxylesterase
VAARYVRGSRRIGSAGCRDLYVEARADRSVVLAAQRRMQAMVPGARVVSLPTGHVPQLTAPKLLADHLIPWLSTGG